jgi:hypothetical protein
MLAAFETLTFEVGRGRIHLPKNSKINRGRTYKAEEGKRLKRFKVYRYDPDSGANPRYDTYTIDLDNADRWFSTQYQDQE